MTVRLSWSWVRSRLPLAFVVYALLFCFLVKRYYQHGIVEIHFAQSNTMDLDVEKVWGAAETWWDYDALLPAGAEPRNVTILMWTEYYHNKDLTEHVRNESPIPEWCNVTFDRRKRKEAAALVFHVTGSDTNLADLPPRRLNQPWVYYIIEPPSYMARDTKPFNGLFNRTMTYRLDSDFPCPYGYVVPRTKPLPLNPYLSDPAFPRKSKKKLVAWMVSHCSTTGKRELIADKLKKLVKVDVYGSCGSLQCNREDEEGCYKKLGDEYKFYLSFENSLCKDYITEKFSNALKYNLVPIVYGGGNYSAILPHPKSYIAVSDFKSVADLAKYLKYLDSNDTAYAEYFQWRQYYKVEIRQGFAGFRRMCYALQKESEYNIYKDITLESCGYFAQQKVNIIPDRGGQKRALVNLQQK